MPASTAASGFAVTAITRPSGSATPASRSQPSAASMLASVSSVVKVFDATTTSVVAGSSGFTASSNAAPSMFDRKRTSSARRAPAERIDQQRRPKHRAADADVQDAGDVAERAGFDRIDQRAHALAPSSREIDVVRRAAAALGDMRRRRGPRSD